jgi:hypothetical protein
VIELDLRELEIRDGLDIFNIGMPWTGVPGAVLPYFTENLEVFSGYFLPDRFTGECIGLFAHGVPLDIVVQKVDDLFRHGIRIVEGHNSAPAFGKHLGGIPVGVEMMALPVPMA